MMIKSVHDLEPQNIYIHKGVSTYNILLYILKHRNNRVCNQHIDKVALAPKGASPEEKLKCVERGLSNISLLKWSGS